MENKILHLKDISGNITFLGAEGFSTLEDYLRKEYKKGKELKIDVSGVSILDKLTVELARLKAVYNCIYLNMDDRENIIEAYINSYYFIKEMLGTEKYGKWLMNKIEIANYPYMIYDNRLNKSVLTSEMDIIKPIKTDKKDRLVYHKLKSYYTEPIYLAEALQSNSTDIWTKEEVFIGDLGYPEVGIRFPATYEEYTTLNLIESVLINKKLVIKEEVLS